jgi:hypothetical protein
MLLLMLLLDVEAELEGGGSLGGGGSIITGGLVRSIGLGDNVGDNVPEDGTLGRVSGVIVAMEAPVPTRARC